MIQKMVQIMKLNRKIDQIIIICCHSNIYYLFSSLLPIND